MTFDTVIMVDWSGGNDRGATPKKDAIWTCYATRFETQSPLYHRNRQVAESWLMDTLTAEHAAGRNTLVGFDLCFAFPTGFAEALTGDKDPLALWDWFAARVKDSPKANNRFDLAGQINAQFKGVGPFWGNGLQRDVPDLPRKGSERSCTVFPEKRSTDAQAKGAFSPWQLAGAGAVGSQVIMGMPMLSRLRHHFAADLGVWPFEAPDRAITLAETFFSLMPNALAQRCGAGQIRDAEQVRLFAQTFATLPVRLMTTILDRPRADEGWVLGLGNEDELEQHNMSLAPPPLRNDCFAMPQGAYWTPVADALKHLRDALHPVTDIETGDVAWAAGRILAADANAKRAHPPQANAAVDGYGFAGPIDAGAHQMPLVEGRAAAGAPYPHAVPQGHAVRILTGANLPEGVDTVILQEDVTTDSQHIAFHGPLKAGANARPAGEDMQAGDLILPQARMLTPADLATLTAAGVGEVKLRKKLRVGVLSTGDELADPGADITDAQIYDANRPMLCATLRAWGYEVVDLGRAPDDRDKLRAQLDAAAENCDAILTSGGASGGDEDHMSALLTETGTHVLWRIAMKPGRPLALGLWHGTPIFGLPGNPVAAQICALIFARPALSVLAGGAWLEPQSYAMPAGFSKSKKAGRREYLRARIESGAVSVFGSEGSGRISGLSWATGLVELPDEAVQISPGTSVTYIPFESFGL